jgi:hypothetical protein
MRKVVVAVPALGAGLALMMTEGVIESTGPSRATAPSPVLAPMAPPSIPVQRRVLILRDRSGDFMVCKRSGAWYVCGSRAVDVGDPGDRRPK